MSQQSKDRLHTNKEADGLTLYDCIVVGAGIEGSATAHQLASKKYKTLLLEQFPLPHSRGSSHGQTRCIRYAYNKRVYADMMTEAYPMWHKLERDTNTTLYRKTGLLVLQEDLKHDPNETSTLEMRFQNVRNLGLPATKLTSREINVNYPGVDYGPKYSGFLDHEAGVLMADKCLRCYQQQFVNCGGQLHDGEKVTEIIPGNIVTVNTSKGRYRARSIVLTAGPWSGEILTRLGLRLPLKTWRMNVCYWKEKRMGTFKDFPVFVEMASSDRYNIPGHETPPQAGVCYGVPSLEYPGMMKICYHTGNTLVLPDERDKVNDDSEEDVKVLQRYIRDHFPGLENVPAIREYCMYTDTPDQDLVLDRHPIHSNIVIGCGMSGHGFKLAPVVGKILCELAMGLPQSYNLEAFSLSRFDRTKKITSKL